MKNKDLEDAKNMLTATLVESTKTPTLYDPSTEVERSLSSFLQHRLTKLQEDASREETIWEAITERVSEFNPDQLMRLLNILQENSNSGVEKILSPFIPRAGERIPLLPDNSKKSKDIVEETIFNESGKDLMEAFSELNSLVREMAKTRETEDIKKVLS